MAGLGHGTIEREEVYLPNCEASAATLCGGVHLHRGKFPPKILSRKFLFSKHSINQK